jgi:hypothetical protein
LNSTKHGASNPLPVTAPISGVITEWKTNVQIAGVEPEEEAFIGSLYKQVLNVFRNAGGDTHTLVGESTGSAPLSDETQDQCPQSAAYQTSCPVVTISSLVVGKKAVTLHVGHEPGGIGRRDCHGGPRKRH